MWEMKNDIETQKTKMQLKTSTHRMHLCRCVYLFSYPHKAWCECWWCACALYLCLSVCPRLYLDWEDKTFIRRRAAAVWTEMEDLHTLAFTFHFTFHHRIKLKLWMRRFVISNYIQLSLHIAQIQIVILMLRIVAVVVVVVVAEVCCCDPINK